MKRVNLILIRIFQLVVFLLFTFFVLAYFGALLLVPLSALTQLTGILSLVGIPGTLAAILSLPIVGYLGYLVYRIPGLVIMLFETGFEVAIIGQSRIADFSGLAESVRQSD